MSRETFTPAEIEAARIYAGAIMDGRSPAGRIEFLARHQAETARLAAWYTNRVRLEYVRLLALAEAVTGKFEVPPQTWYEARFLEQAAGLPIGTLPEDTDR